jgi:hypothetical protein
MNVQDVIEKALNGQEGIPVVPAAHDTCDDDQIAKLAAALNFIGTNLEESLEKEAMTDAEIDARLAAESSGDPRYTGRLERGAKYIGELTGISGMKGQKWRGRAGRGLASATVLGGGIYGAKKGIDHYKKRKEQKKTASVDDILYNAAQAGKASLLEKVAGLDDVGLAGGTAVGGIGAHIARKRMRAAGMSEEEINDLVTRTSATARGFGMTVGGATLGDIIGAKLHKGVGRDIGMALGGGLGALSTYKSQTNRADRAIKRHKARQKTASVEKVAEDRINPAKISAGAAAPFSGEVMPKGQAVFGGSTTPSQLVAMKAQKVRNRINSDMKQYVKNVGDGYNLQGHLTKFNK